MAKEKVEKKVVERAAGGTTKQMNQQHGEISVVCNLCGTQMSVPTSRFYAQVNEHRLAKKGYTIPELKDKEGNVLREAKEVTAVPFRPRRPLMHKDFGGACEGTFSTVPSVLKRQTHKKSRDRVARGSRK